MGSIRENDKEEVRCGIDSSKIFFTSDLHFGHNNVIRFCDRPFNSRIIKYRDDGHPVYDIYEMQEALIKNYNSVVPEDGLCIWVGDCFFCPKSVSKRIMKRLNGRKILVIGNHDKNMFQMMNLGFDFATYQLRLNMAGHPVVVSHYPWKTHYDCYEEEYKFYDRCPEPMSKNDWLIHGHVHEKWRQRDNMINVGVDSWDYKPVSWKQIESLINKGPRLLDRFGNSFKGEK